MVLISFEGGVAGRLPRDKRAERGDVAVRAITQRCSLDLEGEKRKKKKKKKKKERKEKKEEEEEKITRKRREEERRKQENEENEGTPHNGN
jgi:hypothetical protein